MHNFFSSVNASHINQSNNTLIDILCERNLEKDYDVEYSYEEERNILYIIVSFGFAKRESDIATR